SKQRKVRSMPSLLIITRSGYLSKSITEMNKLWLTVLGLFLFSLAHAQDEWIIKADKIDPANYYGITVANGMIGIVSSPEPFKVKNVVLAGAYDLYGRGRVSNFLN